MLDLYYNFMTQDAILQILSEIKKNTYNNYKITNLKYNYNNFLKINNFKNKLSIINILYYEGYINGYTVSFFYKNKNKIIYLNNDLLLTKKILNNFYFLYNYYLYFFFNNIIKNENTFLNRKIINKLEKIEYTLYKKKNFFLYKKYNNNIKKNISKKNFSINNNLLKKLKVNINIYHKYTNKLSLINYFLIISKPSRRIFINVKELDQLLFFYTKKIKLKKKKSLGLLLLSTSKGILSNSLAKKYNVGGELLVMIF